MFSLKSMNPDDIIMFLTAATMLLADNRDVEELRIISNALSTLSCMISTAACQRLVVDANRLLILNQDEKSDKIEKVNSDKSNDDNAPNQAEKTSTDNIDLKSVNDLLIDIQSKMKDLDSKMSLYGSQSIVENQKKYKF